MQALVVLEQYLELIIKYVPNLYVYAAVLLIYVLYRFIFNGAIFKIQGDYNQKLKNIGRPLPAYPNGWYIVAHSYEVVKGQSLAVDIAGENLVIFRSSQTNQTYILEAYCKHLGANLGIGGKVINKNCIMCPFHGWLYEGTTGLCVDYNGKPIKASSVQYNQDFCQKGKKLEWIQEKNCEVRLRKYPSCELNGYIYVWIHSLKEYQDNPQYPVFDLSPITKDLQYRAKTIHEAKCHIQDIPENGSDIFHFKYVHPQVIPGLNIVNFLWKAKWKRGDDPDIRQMFEHKLKYVQEFKQKIYKNYIESYPDKKYLSVGYIDNYINLPIFGHKYLFNVTIIQQGCSLVYIFLKSPIHTYLFFHFLQPKEKYKQIISHQCYSSKWVPFWISAISTKVEGNQVTNDMYIWDSKKFGRKVHFKKGEQADKFLKTWREWYSQYYEGCLDKEREREKISTDW